MHYLHLYLRLWTLLKFFVVQKSKAKSNKLNSWCFLVHALLSFGPILSTCITVCSATRVFFWFFDSCAVLLIDRSIKCHNQNGGCRVQRSTWYIEYYPVHAYFDATTRSYWQVLGCWHCMCARFFETTCFIQPKKNSLLHNPWDSDFWWICDSRFQLTVT